MEGSEIKIQLPTPEEINRQITEAVAKSAIGDQLRKVVDEEVKRISGHTYDNPLRKVVQDEIMRTVVEILRAEPFATQIRDLVKAAVTTSMTQEVVNKVLEAAWEKLSNWRR